MMQPDRADGCGPVQGVAAVIPRGPKLLVIQRSQFVRAPGRYCFPGGGVEPGEEESAALIRELREELAVDVAPRKRLWTSVTPWSVRLAWWFAELEADGAPCPNPREVAAVHWLHLAEIRQLPGLLESNHQFLDAFARGEFDWRLPHDVES